MKPSANPYGSDLSGLICAYAFAPENTGRPLSSTEVEQWLHDKAGEREEPAEPEFIWLHFNLSNSASEKWLQRHLPISEVFYEALREGTRSTRIEYADDALIAVLNDVLYDFSFDASEISTLYLWISDRVLVTARSKPLRSVDRLRGAVRGGERFRSSTELLVHLLRDEGDVLIQIVRDVTARVDAVEDQLLSRRIEGNRNQLGNLRRLLVRLQRLLVPEPAALFRLLNRPPAWMAGNDVQDLRQSTEEFSTVLQDMVSLQERIKLLQEEIAAEINEQNNRSLFVLTIVSVLALPINIIAGLLGMNVGGIPLAQEPDGFWIIVGIIATFTAVAGYWAFRNKRDS
jgi:zinc transporter